MKKELREKIWKKYDCKCAYCGEDLKYKEMQVDHIEAKSLGGKDDIENYNPSCRQCNFYKGTYSLDEFKKRLATINKRIQKPFIVRLAMKYGLISFKPFDGKFYYEKRNEQLPIHNISGSVYLTENQIAELAEIGSQHLYLGAMDEGRISYGGIMEILKKYEELRKTDC